MALDQKIKIEEDSTGPSCNPGRNCDLLEKNGVIQVIVDDLSEGTIVVSYSLNDNLYQGVLLQLNRERGIPCGISFPKDFCSPQSGITAEEQLEVPPINQRQTYFQNKDVTGSVSPVKTGHGLRKIVKPPARFVNARSLRMRHRPTLCLKCKALCESQEGKSGGESNSKSTTTAVKAPPVTRKSNGKPAVNTVVKNQLTSSQKEDFSFVSVGSKDFIENYWKRPSLTAPILEDCSKIVEPRTDDQIYETPPKLNVVKLDTLGSHENISSHNTIGNGNEVHRSAPAHKKMTAQKSEDNITCNTISPKQVGSAPKTVVKKAKGRKGLTKKAKATNVTTTARSHLNNSDQLGSATVGSEGWISVTPTTVGPDSSTTELTSISPIFKQIPDAAPAKKLKITLPKPPSGSFGRKTSLVECLKPTEPRACRVETETVSSLPGRLEDSHPTTAAESNGKTIKESFKTPAIKICVGDLTLKIPPKLTEDCGQTAETISERKLRKAFRKLKKDARKKLSMSTEGSPDIASLDSTNTTELQLTSDVQDRTPVSPTINGPSFDATSEHFELAVRKKKKDKKKKKSRPYQDDSLDDENGNSALLCTAGYAGLTSNATELSNTSVSSSPSDGVCSDSVELLRDCSPTLEDSEEKVEATPKRLCLSLKRYTTESSTSWDIASNLVPDTTDEEVSVGSHDFPVNSSSSDICLSTSTSVDSYTDSSSSTEYKKGEVVWGKLPGCPWWPAKILDIVACDTETEEEASAHVSWYKAQTESKVSFSQLVPFLSEYNAKYVRYRKRGNYQNAVQEALEEVGQEKPTISS